MRAPRPDFAGNRGGQMGNRMGPTRPNMDFTMGTMPGSKQPPKVNGPPSMRAEGGNFRPQLGGVGNLNVPPPMRPIQGFAPPPSNLPPANMPTSNIPPANLPPPNLPSSNMPPSATGMPIGLPPQGFKPGPFVPPGSMGMPMGGPPPLQGPRPTNAPPGPFPPTIGNPPPQMAPPKQPQPPQNE